jgi:phosphate transport system permease protein
MTSTPLSAQDLKATGRSRRRLIKNKVFEILAVSAAVAAIAVLGIVVWSVFIRGVKALALNFFTKGPAVFGPSGGGVAPGLGGTLILVGIATAMALPTALATATTSKSRVEGSANASALWLDVLNGFPST